MKKGIVISILFLVAIYSCDNLFNYHLIDNNSKRKEVHKQFVERIKLIEPFDSSIAGILKSDLKLKEREGFEFLYAYMPLSDLAMHKPEYVLKNVRLALKAQQHFKWAKKIPNEIFLHFVLPYRVNNEYTDEAREVFFEELKERLAGLDVYQAALEVNHWCHEKVSYQSTDERTCGPLTAVRSAFGRCGEESTFAVAAYRSVGIPARQVYTPRWAHTDDNHAWVEVWINGKWYFLGACEPEPELNMGWFAGPAKRTMMTRTFVFGKYDGPEEKISQTEYYTEINLMPSYAPTRKLTVIVNDSIGQPVEGARVEFQLYNYAEFYPIATLKTDSKGTCNLTTGIGDLMIWVQKDNLFAFEKAERNSSSISITLKNGVSTTNLTLTLIPPDEIPVPPIDNKKAEENSKRLKIEDEIRNSYISTFIDSAGAANLAMEKGVSIDDTWTFLRKSRGNWNEIFNFIKGLEPKDISVGMAMLATLREKDLRDVAAQTLFDHLLRIDSFPALTNPKDVAMFDSYVLSPRIGREFITPWRSFLQNTFSFEEIAFIRNNPSNLVDWIKEYIICDTATNYYRVPLSPESVYQIRRADEYSMAIFFVAACRSFGIPARLEPASKKPQYYMNDQWIDVSLTGKAEPIAFTKGMLNISIDDNSAIKQPVYYTHFTLAKFSQGRYITLDYENNAMLKQFPAKLELDEGLYRLVVGNRHKSGAVSCIISHFNIEKGKTTSVNINIPSTKLQVSNTISINPRLVLPDIQDNSHKTISEIANSKRMVVAIIDPLAEPTRHLLIDISKLAKEFDKVGSPIALVISKNKASSQINLNQLFSGSSYPKTLSMGTDSNGEFETEVAKVLNLSAGNYYPVVLVLNGTGEVLFHSTGYRINLGQDLLNILSK